MKKTTPKVDYEGLRRITFTTGEFSHQLDKLILINYDGEQVVHSDYWFYLVPEKSCTALSVYVLGDCYSVDRKDQLQMVNVSSGMDRNISSKRNVSVGPFWGKKTGEDVACLIARIIGGKPSGGMVVLVGQKSYLHKEYMDQRKGWTELYKAEPAIIKKIEEDKNEKLDWEELVKDYCALHKEN